VTPDGQYGVLFDLDGTLVASERLYFNATERILRPLGRSLDELTPFEKSQIPGRAAHENMRLFQAKFGLAGTPEDLTRTRMDLILAAIDEEGVAVTPGTFEFLAAVKDAGLRTALASSSQGRYVRKVLQKIGLGAFFDAVKTGDDVTRYKPDPQIFLMALDALGLSPARCIVVEDAHSGILAGHAAGMKVLAVTSDYTLPEQTALADRIVPDFRGLGARDVLGLIEGA